ncbi:MAG: 4Fe-4S binding protein, partial [Arenibacterium sp.]
MNSALRAFLALASLLVSVLAAQAEPSERARLETLIVPPMSLGELISNNGVYEHLTSGGADAGYVSETDPMAQLPGCSGAARNARIVLDLDSRFRDVQ